MYIMKKQSFSICIVAIFFVTALNFSPASARDLIISMAQLPKILESPDEGIFVDMVKAMDNVYDGKIERKVFPFARSIDNVIKGEADFHLPMIRNTIVPESSLPYAFSTDKTGDVCFVIFSHKPVFDSGRFTKTRKHYQSRDTAVLKNGVVPTKSGGRLDGFDLFRNGYFQFFKYVTLNIGQFCIL